MTRGNYTALHIRAGSSMLRLTDAPGVGEVIAIPHPDEYANPIPQMWMDAFQVKCRHTDVLNVKLRFLDCFERASHVTTRG
jgi:hypothetical protein